MNPPYTSQRAVLAGPQGEYRYWLERQWWEPPPTIPVRTIGWIGYNPSTADARWDDATIRKEVGFSKRWGYHRLVKANLYAYRATDWRRLREVEDPHGPEIHTYLDRVFAEASIVVAAWGAIPILGAYGQTLATWVLNQPKTCCLGYTSEGHPRHPLMLSYTTVLEPVTRSLEGRAYAAYSRDFPRSDPRD